MNQKICNIRNILKEKNSLIHCITNPISINQCANAILSVGAKPIMAEHPQEVAEITRTANALLVNIGNITDVRMESILISAKEANRIGIPIVLDAVGVACSSLRREFVKEFLKNISPTVIKGNYSEIMALYNESYRSAGVDSDSSLKTEKTENASIELSRMLGVTVLASGKQDIVTDGKILAKINNGTPLLSSVTGTGCMQGALCASFLSAENSIYSVITACTILGICGELALTDKGIGSFMVNLMDVISTLKDTDIIKYSDTEVQKIENV